MKHQHSLFLLASAVVLTAVAAAAESMIVPCDQPAKSRKRGVCNNQADAKDFLALAPGISWYYTWHFTDTHHAPKEARIELLAGDKILAEFTGKSTGWQTLDARLALPAGKSSFRIRSNSAARLNWIEFKPR